MAEKLLLRVYLSASLIDMRLCSLVLSKIAVVSFLKHLPEGKAGIVDQILKCLSIVQTIFPKLTYRETCP